jgi:hypothetical protein
VAKVNYSELIASGLGAAGTAFWYDQVARVNRQQAITDAVLGTALGGLFSLFASQAGLINNLADGAWAGGVVWLLLQG